MRIADANGTRVETVDAGTLRVDGGAMFGAIPKEVWERRADPDERNRILLAMRCLYVETPTTRILVDTGAGQALTAAARNAWAIRNEGSPTRLEDSLRALGVEPGDIDVVILTHLHFDHAGGATRREGERIVPSFPRARHVVRRGEWETARSGDRRVAEAYDPDALEPLATHGLLDLIDRETEVAPGVRVVDMPGHTRDHQGVLVETGAGTLCYPADLVPTAAHIAAAWIMAYDVEPLVTWSEKERWLTRAGADGWLLAFEHDPIVAAARARPAASGPGCVLGRLLLERGTASVTPTEGGGDEPDSGGGEAWRLEDGHCER